MLPLLRWQVPALLEQTESGIRPDRQSVGAVVSNDAERDGARGDGCAGEDCRQARADRID
jgi:hypothetical protein